MPVTNFVWDPLNDSYLIETEGTEATVYTQMPSHFGGLISQRNVDGASYFHCDVIGSTRALTDEDQAITHSLSFDGWGASINLPDLTTPALQWTGFYGSYLDRDLQAYYIRSRIYQPLLARWSSFDPLRPSGRLNHFEYGLNSPIHINDPSGCVAVKYTPSRGTFKVVRMSSDYKPTNNTPAVPNDIGSSIDDQWHTTPNVWSSDENPPASGQCCKCKSVGFVQIVKTMILYLPFRYSPFPIANIFGRNWHLDGSVPYVHSNTLNTCPLFGPPVGGIAGYTDFHDDPGYSSPSLLVAFAQQAEACVVCLEGRERALDGAHVYGCIGWSQVFVRSPFSTTGIAAGFRSIRNIDTIIDSSLVPTGVLLKADNTAGTAPSAEFEAMWSQYI